MTSSTRWLLLDFDNCQMETEKVALPSLIERINLLYGDQLPEPLTLKAFQDNFHGLAREGLCEKISEYFGIHVDYPTLFKDREWNMLQYLQKVGVTMAPNLVETLEALEKEGYRFAFVSNNNIQRGLAAMRYATNGQGDRLARLFGTAFFEAGDRQKPLPDIYLRAMAQLGTSPEYCFAVEDSVTGVTSACAAGLRTFGFPHFAEDPAAAAQKLTAAGVVACFSDWAELPGLLDGF